jgi:hypothetical protein
LRCSNKIGTNLFILSFAGACPIYFHVYRADSRIARRQRLFLQSVQLACPLAKDPGTADCSADIRPGFFGPFWEESMTLIHKPLNRRSILKAGTAGGVALATPTIFTSSAWSAGYLNEPTGAEVTLGFNVPQTGAYADEGADELRAYQLAVKHINGEGDGGMLNTFSSKALTRQRRERQEGRIRDR